MPKPEKTEDPPAPPPGGGPTAENFRAQLEQLQQKYLALEEQFAAATKARDPERLAALQKKLDETRGTLARVLSKRRKEVKTTQRPPAPPKKKPETYINPYLDFWGAWHQAHDDER